MVPPLHPPAVSVMVPVPHLSPFTAVGVDGNVVHEGGGQFEQLPFEPALKF